MRLLQSLLRGLEALDYLAPLRHPARVTDIAAHLQVDKSSASHLLRTLVAAGYAEQADGRKYQATAKVRKAATPTLEEILTCRSAVHGTLEELVAATGECAHMAALVGTSVWYADKVDPPQAGLKVEHLVGSFAPLHCTALGKAFLAFGDQADAGPLNAHTTHTITRKTALDAEIEATRKRGYAVDDEELTLGIRCAAAPVYDPSGRMIAAIGVSGPTARIDNARLAELGAIVLDRARSQTTGAPNAI
jgi:DNA-binding IclR family transcriptional regulator